MSQFFYDGQIKRFITQFMRVMSNFAYKDAKGQITQIPVRYGDMNRQVAQILNKNSENVIPSAPFISCYVKNLSFARDRIQDPSFVDKVHIRERGFDEQSQLYTQMQGENYTIERIMPTPLSLEFQADIWTTNTDQKLQIIEQVVTLFNPAIDIQTSNNYVDWTSLTYLELTGMTFTSRQIPAGTNNDIDISNMVFLAPIWITPPAKVKKLGIITKIITSIFDEAPGDIASQNYNAESQYTDFFTGRNSMSIQATTLGNYGLLIFNNTATLVRPEIQEHGNSLDVPGVNTPSLSWFSILERYPGKFAADLSQIRLMKPNGTEIISHISVDPIDDSIMHLRFDEDTLPTNTLLDGPNSSARGTIDAVIEPETFNPRPRQPNGTLEWAAVDTRYLILSGINTNTDFPQYNGPDAWKNADGTDFQAKTNDIIQWDGQQWNIIFDSTTAELSYITNSKTGVQYVWDGKEWSKSFEGIYPAISWRLVL